jgi:beta-ureidopropionase / N-carbamoyl-L-amino-acid hydrolase
MGEAGVSLGDVRVNGDRLARRLEELGSIGRDPRGGLSRFAFTPEHAAACQLVAGWMREAGLSPFLDHAGNVIGLGDGEGRAVAAGSHLDTVPMGGTLDGALGVVGAVECAQALRDAGRALRRPFAALAFADEEGNTFGVGCLTSRALTGELSEERMRAIHHRDGRSLAECVSSWACPLPRRAAPVLAAYLELHIEQGPRLDAEGLDAAVATTIAGITRTTITFLGQANHAGTTPMRMRHDALWGASALVLEIRRLALAAEGDAVGTVGRVEVEPGGTNVVPGTARLRVELRSGEEPRLRQLRAAVEGAAHRLAGEYALTAAIDPWDHMTAVPLDAGIRDVALDSARRRGLRAITMPSWAGHDAKILAPHHPVGLIFVPSKNGVSHAPDEFTHPTQLAAGAQILLDTVRGIDAALA